jgi:outer membrane receptor protein involved in Fe transport
MHALQVLSRVRMAMAIALLCIGLAPSGAVAQVPPNVAAMAATISGTVLDAESGEPLHLATVAIFREGEFITGSATGSDGRFDVSPLRPANYEVRISSIGYTSLRIEDVATRPGATADLGTIRLEPATALLGEAEVVAERDLVEQRADRTIYNVADQPIATGGSVVEVLQTLPALEVDLDGNIALRGNQNVAIHVNGRPVPMRGAQLAAFLRQMPADQVQRVEVLSNPSARYEADSMGGIVNVVLKQGVSRGLSGGLTLGGGTAPSATVSGNLAYQRGPLDAFGSYGFRYDDFTLEGGSFRFTPSNQSLPYLDQDMGTGRSNASHILNSSVDYTLREGLSLNARGMLSSRAGSTDNFTTYRYLGADRELVDDAIRNAEGTAAGLNANLAVGLKRAWKPQQHELNIEARYNVNRNEDEDHYVQTRPNMQQSFEQFDAVTTHTGDATFQIDYQRPVAEGRIEVGTRAGLRRTDNDRRGTIHPSQFEYDQDVYAAYLQGAQKFGDFEIQLGLRAEHTDTAARFAVTATDSTFGRTYTDVFPSAFVAYTPWLGGTFRVGYSRRINRPWPQQLNPFPTSDDPLNVRRGNPNLQPEYTDSFELTASQFLPFGMVSLTPFYRRTTNVIRPRFLFDTATGISTFTQANLDVDDSYGTDVTLALRFGQQLQGFLSGSVYRSVTSAGSIETGLGTDALAYTLRGSLNGRIRDGLNAQLFGFWRSPMQSIDGRMSGFAMTSLGLRQQLMGEQATLGLRINDPFDIARFEYVSNRPDVSASGFRDPSLRRVDLTFTYTFGQVSQQQRRRRAQEDMPDIPQDGFGF